MIAVSDPVSGLEVSRDDLSKAVRIVAGISPEMEQSREPSV